VCSSDLLTVLIDVGTDGARGLYIFAASARPSLFVEVPHPVSDRETERLGGLVFQRATASGLFVAGALRSAADGRADVAHERTSIFEAVQDGATTSPATDTGRAPLVVQVHGYADDSLEGFDAVVSTGNTRSSAASVAAGEGLTAAGFRTCLAWSASCGDLEAFTNVQGQAARNRGVDFVHVELSHAVRNDDHRLGAAAVALAAAMVRAVR